MYIISHQTQMQFNNTMESGYIYIFSVSICYDVGEAMVESILCCEIEIHVYHVFDIKKFKHSCKVAMMERLFI